jgi:hypothetical protein
MSRIIFVILSLTCLVAPPLRGVQNITNGSFDTTPPANSDIPNWVTIGDTDDTGWGAPGITGWKYVGIIGSASGVYLGNGWVLTAGHVGYGNFTLNGTVYAAISGSGQYIAPDASTQTSADLYVFQIKSPPSLPPLIISAHPPVAFSSSQAGSSVAILGYGGSAPNLSWGLNTVTEINVSVDLTQGSPSYPFISNDFLTDDGAVNRGSSSITNNFTLYGGDSGGADFIFNATTGKWELAGINEITGSYSNYSGTYDGNGYFSGMVQLSTYASQINAIVNPAPTDTPTMPLPALLVMACLLLMAASHSLRTRNARG